MDYVHLLEATHVIRYLVDSCASELSELDVDTRDFTLAYDSLYAYKDSGPNPLADRLAAQTITSLRTLAAELNRRAVRGCSNGSTFARVRYKITDVRRKMEVVMARVHDKNQENQHVQNASTAGSADQPQG
jgi:hypothetical protein